MMFSGTTSRVFCGLLQRLSNELVVVNGSSWQNSTSAIESSTEVHSAAYHLVPQAVTTRPRCPWDHSSALVCTILVISRGAIMGPVFRLGMSRPHRFLALLTTLSASVCHA